MSQQPLFVDLLPTVEGMIQGVVAVRKLSDGPPHWGRNQYDLQCQSCGAIETPKILVSMRFKFPSCTATGTNGKNRTRLCPDCHADVCDGRSSCWGMPGMRGHHL